MHFQCRENRYVSEMNKKSIRTNIEPSSVALTSSSDKRVMGRKQIIWLHPVPLYSKCFRLLFIKLRFHYEDTEYYQ